MSSKHRDLQNKDKDKDKDKDKSSQLYIPSWLLTALCLVLAVTGKWRFYAVRMRKLAQTSRAGQGEKANYTLYKDKQSRTSRKGKSHIALQSTKTSRVRQGEKANHTLYRVLGKDIKKRGKENRVQCPRNTDLQNKDKDKDKWTKAGKRRCGSMYHEQHHAQKSIAIWGKAD